MESSPPRLRFCSSVPLPPLVFSILSRSTAPSFFPSCSGNEWPFSFPPPEGFPSKPFPRPGPLPPLSPSRRVYWQSVRAGVTNPFLFFHHCTGVCLTFSPLGPVLPPPLRSATSGRFCRSLQIFVFKNEEAKPRVFTLPLSRLFLDPV